MTAGESYDYDSSVLESWDTMIRGAVDSDARCHELAVVTPGEFWYWPIVGCWIDRFGMVTSVSGGEATHEEELHGFNPGQSWLEWSQKIPALWKQWESLLPDPADLESSRTTIHLAASQLALDPKQKGYDTDASHHAADFASFIDVMKTEVGGMGGQAMITFNHEIASRVTYTSKAQGAAALVASYAVQAEQAVWRTARTNLGKTVEQAKAAFQGAYPGGHGGGDLGWLDMVSEVTGALAIIPSPASPFLGTVSSAAGSLSTFADYLEPNTDPLPLGADSPQAVCDNVQKALEDLNKQIVNGENAIAQGCTAAKNTTHGDPATYDLSPTDKPAILDEDDPRDLMVLDVEYDRLDDLANVTLPGIASGFDLAHHFLDDAVSAGPWERPAGLGRNPFTEYSAYVAELQALMHSTSWKLSASAGHMNQVVRDFQHTDDWVARAHQDLVNDTAAVGSGPAH